MTGERNSSVASDEDEFPSPADFKAKPLLWVAAVLYATAFVLFVGPIVIFLLAASGIINAYYAYVFWVAAITTPIALAALVLAVVVSFVAARRGYSISEGGRTPERSGHDA